MVMEENNLVSAAFLCIGNEILSGRTQDANVRVLAKWLRTRGVPLEHVRIVPDTYPAIIDNLNALRTSHTYVFTSGGLGSTHDDITTDAIARAFSLTVHEHPDAIQKMLLWYKDKGGLTQSRRRMARVPTSAILIGNGITGAPGYCIENVFVLAGVPAIFAVMLDYIDPMIQHANPLVSQTLTVLSGETQFAQLLESLQDSHPEVEIGSYPQQNEKLGYFSHLVISGNDIQKIKQAAAEMLIRFQQHDFAISTDNIIT